MCSFQDQWRSREALLSHIGLSRAGSSGRSRHLKGCRYCKRGEYLARAADCLVCHTAPPGKAYAGGLAFSLPFGLLYSTNITPDKETGSAIIAMRISSTPYDAASAVTGRAFIPLCPLRLTPILPMPTCWRSRSICSASRPFIPQARKHADVPLQSALVALFLVAIVQSG